eukprot:7911634-Pyramimonas_sp.AAC.1
MASQVSDVVGGDLCFVVVISAWGRRRQYIVSHVSMRYVFEEVVHVSRWVDFRSVIAQGCRMRIRDLRLNR